VADLGGVPRNNLCKKPRAASEVTYEKFSKNLGRGYENSKAVLQIRSQILNILFVCLLLGSMLLHAWRQLSTPNLASVLDDRQGVLVRGDSPHHGTAVVTQSQGIGITTGIDFQSNEDTGSNDTSQNLIVSSSGSGVGSTMRAARMGLGIGLASILDPSPPSSGDAKPHIYQRSNTSHLDSDLEPKDLQGHVSECPKMVPPVAATLSQASQSSVDPAPWGSLVSSSNHTSSGGHLPLSEHCQKFCSCRRTVVRKCLPARTDADSRPSPICCTKAFDAIGRPNSGLYTVCDLHGRVRPSNDLRAKCRHRSNDCRSNTRCGADNGLSSDQQRPSNDLQADDYHCRLHCQNMSGICGNNFAPSSTHLGGESGLQRDPSRTSDFESSTPRTQRPSNDLQVEGDIVLGTSLSAFHCQHTPASPLYCNCCPSHYVVATSTPAISTISHNSSAVMSPGQGSTSLYDELRPFLIGYDDYDDHDDHLSTSSGSVTTDDEY